MKIIFKATHIDLTPSIKTYVDEKIGSLGRYLQRIEAGGEVTATVEIGRTTHHHHKGDVFRAEVNMPLPGKMLRAEHVARDMRAAIDRVRNTLRLKITKYRAVHLVRRILRR